MSRFAGRRILVTGGAGGIGGAIEERFLGEGAQVAALDLREARRGTLALVADLRDRAAVSTALARAWEAFAGLDVLVNAAGVYPNLRSLIWRRRIGTPS